MKPRDIRDLVHFSDDEPRHETLFETEHLWSEVICLQGAQGSGRWPTDASDAVLVVLSGEVATQVGKSRARMRQWESLLVPAGAELTIKNASDGPGRRADDRRASADADARALGRTSPNAPARASAVQTERHHEARDARPER